MNEYLIVQDVAYKYKIYKQRMIIAKIVNCKKILKYILLTQKGLFYK